MCKRSGYFAFAVAGFKKELWKLPLQVSVVMWTHRDRCDLQVRGNPLVECDESLSGEVSTNRVYGGKVWSETHLYCAAGFTVCSSDINVEIVPYNFVEFFCIAFSNVVPNNPRYIHRSDMS